MNGPRTDREVMDGWDRGISGTVFHDDRVVHVEHVWGTAITINLKRTAGRRAEARAALGDCRKLFRDIDATFSTFTPVSEVAFYRSGLPREGRASHEFDQVMATCRDLRSITRGAFDPWCVPGGYDPSGYVKGWGAGRASALLDAAGFVDHLVNAGGDICARGDEVPGSGQGWPVGIVNPHRPREVIEVVTVRDGAVATSARYERGDHVWDPRTGVPAVSVDSATVIGPDPGVADAFASAALVCGLASTEWLVDAGPEWSLHLVIGEAAHTYGTAFAAR